MRLFKLIVTLVILCLIGIFIYQNMQTWVQPVGFKLNLYFYQTNPEKPPSIELYPVLLLSALIGFILGLAVLLRPYFKTRRLLKRERQEKKQAQEELTLRQTRVQSQGETPTASVPTDPGAGSEKEE